MPTTSSQNYTASGLNEIGRLRNYWHVVALSRELKTGRMLKRTLYGQPLLLWRDAGRQLHALDDCCAHRRAPLEVRDFQRNQVVCPYHGWQYNAEGKLACVPSDPAAAQRLKCAIPNYPTLEMFGFVWIHLGASESIQSPADNLRDFLQFNEYANWVATFRQLEFATSDELLIDNFMDPTHTAVVHDGLIRSSGQQTEHEMKVTTHDQGVRVEFAERQEQVGVGLRFMFGSSMRVQHTDEFLLPNLVRVTYTINDQRCFVALIACTSLGPLGSSRTLAMVQLRYDFGWATRLAQPVIAWLAGKVLRQDYQITADQFANRNAFPQAQECKIAADTVATRVSRLRAQLVSGNESIQSTSQTIRLMF